MYKSPLVPLILFLMAIPTTRSAERPQSSLAAQPNQVFAESTDGFRSQFAAIVEAYRAGDKVTGENLLEQFRLPHSDQWFGEHLGTEESAKLTERYDKLFPVFAADLEHAISEALENNETLVTDLKDGSEEPPSKLPPNMKLTGIKAIKEIILFYSSFELQRNGEIVISWARAFTFEEGAFRFIGFGGKPF
jgi:hypothetical protein